VAQLPHIPRLGTVALQVFRILSIGPGGKKFYFFGSFTTQVNAALAEL
jgi:hypothetical protein